VREIVKTSKVATKEAIGVQKDPQVHQSLMVLKPLSLRYRQWYQE
jgi:hypothetical protein